MLSRKTLRAGLAAGLLLLAPALAHRASAQAPRREPTPNDNLKSVGVLPDHRVTFRAWFSRRADYGTSAAALEELHPGAVRPLYASWWTAGAWAAALAGRPVTAAAP